MGSLEIRSFSKSIRDFANSSKLPAEAKKIVLKDILSEVSQMADEEIIKEVEKMKRKEGKHAESV